MSIIKAETSNKQKVSRIRTRRRWLEPYIVPLAHKRTGADLEDESLACARAYTQASGEGEDCPNTTAGAGAALARVASVPI